MNKLVVRRDHAGGTPATLGGPSEFQAYLSSSRHKKATEALHMERTQILSGVAFVSSNFFGSFYF